MTVKDRMSLPARTRPIARRALSKQSDARLVKLLREGHEAAFEEIVGRYRHSLTAFAVAFVPFHRAEDVVQASLIKAHEALLADDREVSLRAWLFTIVRNRALNAIRDDPEWLELDPSYDGVPQPAAIAEQNEELHRLVEAICALPEAQRAALVGRAIQGEGHAELAADLGTTATAVRGLIFRARTTLRNAFGAAIPLPLLRLLMVRGIRARRWSRRRRDSVRRRRQAGGRDIRDRRRARRRHRPRGISAPRRVEPGERGRKGGGERGAVDREGSGRTPGRSCPVRIGCVGQGQPP